MKSFLALILFGLSLPLVAQSPIGNAQPGNFQIELIQNRGRPFAGQIIDLSGTGFVQTLGNPPVSFSDRVWRMRFSADGEKLYSVTDDNVCEIDWRAQKIRSVLWQPGKDDSHYRSVVSHDGKLFARISRDQDGDKVSVHKTDDGKVLHSFPQKLSGRNAMTWNPDGSQLAVSVDGTIAIHDIATGKILCELNTGEITVSVMEWSPDGHWLAVGTDDWKTRTGQILLISLTEDKDPIVLPGTEDMEFSFSPDSSILAVSCEESRRDILYLWDIKQGKEIKRVSGGFNCVTHSPDGSLLAAGGLSELLVLNARTGEEVCRHHGDSVNTHFYSLAFSPDGKVLATGIEDRIRFRDTSTWELIDPDETLRAPVSALVFSADGKHLITGGWNGDLILWDWEKKTPVWKQLQEPGQWDVRKLSVDEKSRWIGVAQPARHPEKRWVRLVDFNSGETLRYFDVPASDAAPLFHPEKDIAYLSTYKYSITEVNCHTGEPLMIHPVPFLSEIKCSEQISEMQFDPLDKNVIKWAADSQAMGNINIKTGEESQLIESRYGNPDADPIPPRDHEYVAIGYRIKNLSTLYEATKAENSSVCPTARHPSGLLHFTASGPKVRAFDIMSQQFIYNIDMGPGDVDAIALSPDGTTLVAGTTAGLKYISLERDHVDTGKSKQLWQLMGGDDHWMAWQAAWALRKQPGYIELINSELIPAEKPSEGELHRITSMLRDSSHEVRQTAARQWLDLGLELDKATYETLRENGFSFNWPYQIKLVEGTEPWIGYSSSGIGPKPIPPLIPLSEHRRAMRAISMLKTDGSEPAQQLLKQLSEGYQGAPVTRAALKAIR